MAKKTPAAKRRRSASNQRRDAELSHVASNSRGSRSRMVDVGKKIPTRRSALARAWVYFPAGLRDRVLDGRGPKGPIEEVARCAGLLAAKRTAELVPLCHPLALDHLDVRFEPRGRDVLEVLCSASVEGKTGVEMEALVGAALAALTVYDMAKALHKGIRIERLELVEKRGGKSGAWRAPAD